MADGIVMDAQQASHGLARAGLPTGQQVQHLHANKERINGSVIERMKAHLLTEENLRELIKLTNERIGQAKDEYEERLGVLEGQLADARGRLHTFGDDSACEAGSP
jgi:hypothetical protein